MDNQVALSDVSSKNAEENPSPSSPEIPQPIVAPHMAIADHDREYGCKYCHKKFSNKQALGGHQNAHKVERAMEKNARDLHENHFASYFGGGLSYPGISTTTPFLGSYNRSQDFLNRSFNNYPYNPPSQQPGIQISNARPRLPLASDPYAPRQPIPEFNNVYSPWGAPRQRIPQFSGQGSYNMQNPGLNLWPERNIGGGENGNQMNDPGNQQVKDDDIDLSLKL
ncbi:hypothetical protein DH2020_041366 [Rehmannia glutinosa]|uniref:C2H2-type domain-containing protein n=1 Tax=Rehmannia glutinosa TaxID=99300 RepID=A0ABR0UQC5_REHGL